MARGLEQAPGPLNCGDNAKITSQPPVSSAHSSVEKHVK
jgi:hypothetical protein